MLVRQGDVLLLMHNLKHIFLLLLDILQYFTEGLLPFLQIFYSEFYRKGHYDQCELEGDTTNKLYTSLLVCSV